MNAYEALAKRTYAGDAHYAEAGLDELAATASVGGGSSVGGSGGTDWLVIGIVVAIGAGLFYFMKREEDRLDKMTPEQQHQYRMDQLKSNVAGAVTARLLNG